jgi:hypothetical protein
LGARSVLADGVNHWKLGGVERDAQSSPT